MVLCFVLIYVLFAPYIRFDIFRSYFQVSKNVFSQIFYNCLNEDEIFTGDTTALSLSQNVQQTF